MVNSVDGWVFQKGGPCQDLNFERELLEKRG